ncbi:diguanylate cyclase [Pseudooceanicola sp. 216_PA32_1]|jgi:diguanylate cyclase|uniref:diguanylate cyclase n=1 Tax=Pseudooceanicola pacificus TaxID=2676438 RepID=A0A844W7L2_9RHOB|nr:diguanylate cyclase [Pseudooceanicola pacificus]MWB76418.1 diguanylate cyclase [Pseudooceanicola pacificus]
MLSVLPIIHGIGAMALVTTAYGFIQRSNLSRWMRHTIVGAIFGASAGYSMLDPIVLSTGIVLETHNLLIAFAAFFTGPIGAAIAILVTGAVRMTMDTVVAVTDVTSIASAAIIGLLWSAPALRPKDIEVKHFVFMGLQMSLPLAAVFLVPVLNQQEGLLTVFIGLTGFNVLAACAFGTFLARERRLAKRERALQESVDHDFLTTVLNRGGFFRKYDEVKDHHSDTGGAVLLIDLDRFKNINDTFGHSVGDDVLKTAAEAMKRVVRKGDMLARIGGEEFAVYLPSATEQEAGRIADRIREAITASVCIPTEPDMRITASVGGYHFRTREQPNLAEALNIADQRLYKAKFMGRNRTIMQEQNAGPRLAA